MPEDELVAEAKALGASLEQLQEVRAAGRLPVVNFAAGGVATPADAALMMHLGADGIFIGSGIFKAENPAVRARAVVEATTHFQDPDILARASKGLGAAMAGRSARSLPTPELLATRGW
jgi:pyridoxal 5'-phosphate synthase pdxS subunit